MAKISKVEPIVKEILINEPETRNDDYLLIEAVLRRFTDCSVCLSQVFKNHVSLGIPSIETITRCRRKLQSENPQLADEKTQEIRSQEEQLYFEYALD